VNPSWVRSYIIQYRNRIVGQLLGHTTATTTKRYAHLADDPLRAATDRYGSKIAAFQRAQ